MVVVGFRIGWAEDINDHRDEGRNGQVNHTCQEKTDAIFQKTVGYCG